MNNWLDNVTYGNPVDKFLPYMKEGVYDSLLTELKQYPFPSNSCEMTQDELRQLIELQNSEEQKNQTLVSRYLDYDNDIINTFKTFCKKRIDKDYDEEIDGLIQDLAVLITKLKFAYQRPRPYQLAQYYKARLSQLFLWQRFLLLIPVVIPLKQEYWQNLLEVDTQSIMIF